MEQRTILHLLPLSDQNLITSQKQKVVQQFTSQTVDLRAKEPHTKIVRQHLAVAVQSTSKTLSSFQTTLILKKCLSSIARPFLVVPFTFTSILSIIARTFKNVLSKETLLYQAAIQKTGSALFLTVRQGLIDECNFARSNKANLLKITNNFDGGKNAKVLSNEKEKGGLLKTNGCFILLKIE